MVTIGDAIQSFLEHPESPYMAKGRPRAASTAAPTKSLVEVKKMRWRTVERVSWLRAVSGSVWVISYICFLVVLIIPTALMATSWSFLGRNGRDVSLSDIWGQGFKVHPAATADLGPIRRYAVRSGLSTLLGQVLIANSPQLLMGIAYLFYNKILTRQLVADELLRFLDKNGKKPLRVSSPVGMQRSSYFLSLPLKYSVPLLTLTTVLHWLMSQSLFLVQSSGFGPGPEGERMPVYDNSMRGYSILGSLLALGLGFLMVLAIGVNGALRSYRNVPPGFLRMGHNSRAIEAMCQRPTGDTDAHLFPVSLGMVRDVESEQLGCDGRLLFSTDIHIDLFRGVLREALHGACSKSTGKQATGNVQDNWGRCTQGPVITAPTETDPRYVVNW